MNLDINPIVVPIELLGFTELNSKHVCQTLFNKMAAVLTMNNQFSPTVFLITEETCILINATSFMQNNSTKDELSFFLRESAKETYIIGIAFASQGYVREATKQEQETGIQENYCPVANHPDKQDAIIIQCEWYTSNQYMLTASFTKEKDNNNSEYIQIQPATASQNFDGRFANLFPPTRIGKYYN